MYMLINYISVRAEAQNYQNLLILYVVSEKNKKKIISNVLLIFHPKSLFLGIGGVVVLCPAWRTSYISARFSSSS